MSITDDEVAAEWSMKLEMIECSLHDCRTRQHLIVVDAALELQHHSLAKSNAVVASGEDEGVHQTPEDAAFSVELGVPRNVVFVRLLRLSIRADGLVIADQCRIALKLACGVTSRSIRGSAAGVGTSSLSVSSSSISGTTTPSTE